MRVLLITGSTQHADAVGQAFAQAVPNGTLDVRPPEEAADSLATQPDTHAVLIAADLTGSDAGAASISAVRAASADVSIVALTPHGDDRAEARALLAGAETVLPAADATTPRLAAHLASLGVRAVRPHTNEWRLLYAGRDSDLRRDVAQTLGPRVVLMSLWADGRLVPIIDRPGSATALVVDARDDVDGMLLGLRQVRRAYPTLPTIVVCDTRFHAAFVREGADACAAADVDAPRLIRTVADARAARSAAGELASLRTRESRLRALVEQLPDPVMLVGVDRTVSAVNLAGLDALGTTDARHVIGLPVTDWLEVDAGDLGGFIDGVAAGCASSVVARTPRGSVTRQVLLRAVPFQREPDRPASVLMTLRDAAPDLPDLPALPDGPDVPDVTDLPTTSEPAHVPAITQADLDELTSRLAAATEAHRETTTALESAVARGAQLDALIQQQAAQIQEQEARVAKQTEALLEERRQQEDRLAALERERDALYLDVHDLQHLRDQLPDLQAAQIQEQEAWVAKQTEALLEERRLQEDRLAALERERDDLYRDVHDLQHLRDQLPDLQAAQQRAFDLEGALADAQQVRAQALALEAEVTDLREGRDRTRQCEAALEEARAELVTLRERPATLDTQVDEETRWLLYEVAAIGHITTTADARILGANDVAARLLGHFSCDALQATGQLPAPILHAAGTFAHRPARFEVCLQHGDDGPLHWLVGLATPHAGVPATVTWMLLDVTEQRLQARRTRFLRRMDGLTHVLSAASAESTTLVGRAVPLLDAAADALGGREDLDVPGTRTSLARTQAVLTQLSGYARRRARRETVQDVREIIDAASTVLVHLAGEDITCTVSHADVPLHATLERAEFEPFLTSLMMAGRDALPLGGHLSLTTQAVNTEAGNGGPFFMRPSIEVTLLAEGYGAQRPDSPQALDDAASRLGGDLATTSDDRGEVRWVLRLPRVFVTP